MSYNYPNQGQPGQPPYGAPPGMPPGSGAPGMPPGGPRPMGQPSGPYGSPLPGPMQPPSFPQTPPSMGGAPLRPYSPPVGSGSGALQSSSHPNLLGPRPQMLPGGQPPPLGGSKSMGPGPMGAAGPHPGPPGMPTPPAGPHMPPPFPGQPPAQPGSFQAQPGPIQSGSFTGQPGPNQPGAYPGQPGPNQPGAFPGQPGSGQSGSFTGQPGPSQPGAFPSQTGPNGPNASGQRMPPGAAHAHHHHRKYPYAADAAQAGQMAQPPSGQYGAPAPGGFPGAPGMMGPGPVTGYPGPAQPGAFPGPAPMGAQPGYPGMPAPMGAAGGMMGAPQQFMQSVNLFQTAQMPPNPASPAPMPALTHDIQDRNCPPKYMRCTLTAIPANSSLLQKTRLPLGLHVFPYAKVNPPEELPVVQPPTIVRCRACRTYINPFVAFTDQARHWRCNICFRQNEVPQDFHYDPVTRQAIDPMQRPEMRSAMVEYIAPAEYMVRPPQPAVHLFLIDVSQAAIESGMVATTVATIREHLMGLPGDDRRMVGFITYDNSLHYYKLKSTQSQPQMFVVTDLEDGDVFLPSPTDLLVNVKECSEIIYTLLDRLPKMFERPTTNQSAMGPALQGAFKLMSPTGGRIMVFQACLPTIGAAKLTPRENAQLRGTGKEFQMLEPAVDFYKKYAVDCSRQQIGVDVFVFGSGYMDVASIGALAKYSSGTCFHYPDFSVRTYPSQVYRYQQDLAHVLTRPLGLEAVMRIRATKGINLHTFHGNFFVRSTDLLALPNVSPDNAFAVQAAIEENLNQSSIVCFQSALLYTTTSGERRIRVHTLAVPVTEDIPTVFAGADQDAIAALVAKMAVDRAMTSKLTDAREAVLNLLIDSLKSYQVACGGSQPGMAAPPSLSSLPMMAHGLLKHSGLRLGTFTSLDERADAHNYYKTMSVPQLVAYLLPRMYALHDMGPQAGIPDEQGNIPMPPLVRVSSESLVPHGIFLLENGVSIYVFVGRHVHPDTIMRLFDHPSYQALPPVQAGQTTHMTGLPELENELSVRVRNIVARIQRQYTNILSMVVVKEDDPRLRPAFAQHLVLDRNDQMISYGEMLQHIERTISK